MQGKGVGSHDRQCVLEDRMSEELPCRCPV